MITLYHGSNERISNIDLTKCNPYKDFGQAFYLTTNPRQAMDVAIARVDIFGGEPIVNTYCFNEQLLKDGTLSFKSFSEYNENGRILYISIVMKRTCLLICILLMLYMDPSPMTVWDFKYETTV